MQLRMSGPWRDLTAANIAALPGQLGVFQVADAGGNVIHIGFAGGRSLFGLRSALADEARNLGAQATSFRYEVNMQYQSRYKELLMLHAADYGDLPEHNRTDRPARLGRLG